MIELLLLSFLAAADPSVTPPAEDSPEAELNFLLRPEVIQRWVQEAPRMCADASSPAECRPAYLSARYSETAMRVCRHVAGLEFRDQHGGTMTTFAQDTIRRTCRSSIEYCRTAWLNYDRINFAGRPRSQTDPRRVTHFALFLNDTCGAEAGDGAPF